MANSTLIPTRLDAFAQFASHLVSSLSANPERYGTTSDLLQPLVAYHSMFTAAYTAATNPMTRTKPAVDLMHERRRELTAAIRSVVGMIQKWSGMTNSLRAELELPPRDASPTPIPPPVEMPIVQVKSVMGRMFEVEVLDGENRKRKPAGVVGAYLYYFVGAMPTADLSQWAFTGGTSRSNPQVEVPEGTAPGTPVWITALWINHRLQTGPACAPVKAFVGFDGLNNVAQAA